MPLVGFRCPDHGESPGRANKISYCVNRCKAPCVAPHVLVAMLENERKNPHKGKVISVTQLTGGCKRKTFLERTLDYYVEPDRKLPTFRGTIVHSVVEQAKSARLKRAKWILEEHLELPVKTASGAWTLSGTLDAYDPKRRTIFDIKTLQDYAVNKMIKGEEEGTWSKHISDSYVKQLNLYRYMAHELKKFKVDHLRLQIIGFGKLFLTGTTVKFGPKKDLQVYTIPDIPILPKELVESWIHTEGDLWYKILFEGASAPVYDDGYEWLCKSCQFFETDFCPNPKLEKAQTFDV